MFTGKTIFISALDWGLGHASRSVPIIRDLLVNNKIIIGVTPLTKIIFDEEFPGLLKINVQPYDIKYSKFLPLWLKLVVDYKKIKAVIKEENKLLKKIIVEHKIDIVISDSRFGLYSENAKSVFITHQLFLKTPFANSYVQKINKKLILNFDEVWVPDYADEKISLSGELSHGPHFHKNLKYIEPKSRLLKSESENKYEGLFLVSGPEPQQSILKNKLILLAKKNPLMKFALVLPYGNTENTDNVSTVVAPDKTQLSKLICESNTVFCRSGYSTLMDLFILGAKNSVLIPTPGQSEQEYLAEYWKEKFNSKIVKQSKIDNFKF